MQVIKMSNREKWLSYKRNNIKGTSGGKFLSKFLFRKHCAFVVENSGKNKGQYTGIYNIHADSNQYTCKIHLKGEDSIHAKYSVVNRDKEHAKLL